MNHSVPLFLLTIDYFLVYHVIIKRHIIIFGIIILAYGMILQIFIWAGKPIYESIDNSIKGKCLKLAFWFCPLMLHDILGTLTKKRLSRGENNSK